MASSTTDLRLPSQPKSTAISYWAVLISRPTESRRLSRPEWRRYTGDHLSTNRARRRSTPLRLTGRLGLGTLPGHYLPRPTQPPTLYGYIRILPVSTRLACTELYTGDQHGPYTRVSFFTPLYTGRAHAPCTQPWTRASRVVSTARAAETARTARKAREHGYSVYRANAVQYGTLQCTL